MKELVVDEESCSRSFNTRILGFNVHRVIFPVSFLIVLALVLVALHDPITFGQSLEGAKGWILKNCD
jgi:BCCT family betaine/carnitine transporter